MPNYDKIYYISQNHGSNLLPFSRYTPSNMPRIEGGQHRRCQDRSYMIINALANGVMLIRNIAKLSEPDFIE